MRLSWEVIATSLKLSHCRWRTMSILWEVIATSRAVVHQAVARWRLFLALEVYEVPRFPACTTRRLESSQAKVLI